MVKNDSGKNIQQLASLWDDQIDEGRIFIQYINHD